MNIKIFADSADLETIVELRKNPRIRGFTTNPSLMRKSGITDYETFAQRILNRIGDHPVSFEVFSDDNGFTGGMYYQALKIASWGDNVYVKIPVTNTKGEPSYNLIHELANQGVKVNVTAVMTDSQIVNSARALVSKTPSYISVFAGRIADTGRDPIKYMEDALYVMRHSAPTSELIWASPREVLNIIQANEIGCHIITVTNDLLKKMHLFGKSLKDYSLETVKMFHDDAKASGYVL